MDYKKSYIILIVGVIGGAVVAFVGVGIGSKTALFGNVLGAIGVMSMLAGIFQAFVYYKCPYCKKSLNIRGKKPSYCPSCGHRLDL